jgi:hypothetical protein
MIQFHLSQPDNMLHRARRTVYSAVAASLAADRPLRGALFWEWEPDAGSRGERAIAIGDTAWE